MYRIVYIVGRVTLFLGELIFENGPGAASLFFETEIWKISNEISDYNNLTLAYVARAIFANLKEDVGELGLITNIILLFIYLFLLVSLIISSL